MNILEHDTEGKFYHEYNNSNTTSSIVSSSSSSASSGGSRSTQDEDTIHSEIKQDYVPTPPSPRMESGGGVTVKEEPAQDTTDSPALFTCENCGKTAYHNSGFETIKLGDIFTHLHELPSSDGTSTRTPNDEGPPKRLCAQCLDSHTSHFGGINGSTAQQNNISDCSNVVSKSNSGHTLLVTSCLPTHTARDKTLLVDQHGEEGSAGQLLQGVPTIIMQNPTHHEPEMHHDLQQQTFYQGQHILQQVKLEPDTMGHPQPHNHNLDNFMLIHDGAAAMYPDNNEMISFQQQQQPDNQFPPQRQVICDNQAAIQHITVVTPGSDIKYTIPTNTIMQLQTKDQVQTNDHLIQFSPGQNHLISLGDGNVISAGGPSGEIANSVPTTTGTFQFLDLSALNKGATLLTTSGAAVVTYTATSTTSSVMTIPTPTSTITPTMTSSSSTKKSSNKSTKKEKSAASGSGAKPKNNNNNNNNSADKKNAQKGQGKVQAESEKIPCDLCKKKFKNPKMAMNHYRRVHQKEARFVCEICGAVFSYRGSLDSHLAVHKQPPEKSHECGKCGMQFSVKANLRQHMRIHSDNPKKFPCDFCPSGFSKRVNLRYHIKRKHPEEAEKMNNNNNSNKDSTTGASGPVGSNLLQAGLAGPITPTTLGANPPGTGGGVGGDDNGKDSKNQGSFKCEHCDRAFLFKNNLKAHLRTHTRDKKYTCELCTKSFIYKESLKNHMLLHSNELPYLCEVCGKKFRDRSNRRKHVKNVHKYLFVNGDINNPVKPGAPPTPGSSQGGPSTTQPGEPPTKKRKSSKKMAQQLETIDETGQDGTPKTRTIIKSPAAPRGKKAKAAAAAASAAAGSAGPIQTKAANTKSVIVSASATATATVVGVDRKIIMSPSPKTPKSHSTLSSVIGGGPVGSPNSLEYVHPHSSLPVTVHVPLAGSQGQFSHGRNIIVKASSTATTSTNVPPNHHQSPPALSPEMYHHSHSQQQQHGHGRGPASMQQNVIVYPKPKVIPDHSQYPSSASSVISQTMQQQAQYYVNPPPDQQQHHHHHHSGYSYLQLTSQQPSPVQSSLLPPQQQQPHSIPSPNPTGFEYVLGSTNHLSSQPQDQRANDPYGSSGGPGSSSQQPMEIQVVNPEYSHHLYSSADPMSYDQQPQHYHWATSAGPPPGLNGSGGHPHPHPPNSSSPYQQLVVAPPVGSNGSSSSGLVNEGPPGHQQHPPVSLAQSYHHDSAGGLNPNPNALSPAAVYAASGAVQGHEVLDPSGNGGNFFYKDFDFSYL